MAITNGIYLGEVALLKFFGDFDWLEDRRRLEFDFDAIAVAGVTFDLPKGGAEKLGAASGLGAENNRTNVLQPKQVKESLFEWRDGQGDFVPEVLDVCCGACSFAPRGLLGLMRKREL